jgi:hypothetical protein
VRSLRHYGRFLNDVIKNFDACEAFLKSLSLCCFVDVFSDAFIQSGEHGSNAHQVGRPHKLLTQHQDEKDCITINFFPYDKSAVTLVVVG